MVVVVVVVVVVVGRPGLSQTKTNSAQAEAGARAELGNRGLMKKDSDGIYTHVAFELNMLKMTFCFFKI